MNNLGFAAVTRTTDKGVYLVYPLEPEGYLPNDLFTKSFGARGKALLLSRGALNIRFEEMSNTHSPKVKEKGPKCVLAQSLITSGQQYHRNWIAQGYIHNHGESDLLLNVLPVSVSSYKAALDRTRVPAGESCVVKVEGVAATEGGFIYQLEIATNDSSRKILKVPIRGYLESPVAFDKPFVRFELPCGEAGNKSVSFEQASDFDARMLVVKSKYGRCKASIVHSEKSISITWQPTPVAGSYQDELSICYGESEYAIPSRLYVSATISNHITCTPETILVPIDPQDGKWSRSITLQSIRDISASEVVMVASNLAMNETINCEFKQVSINRIEARITTANFKHNQQTAKPREIIFALGKHSVSVPILMNPIRKEEK